jgi:hypothetical protein
LGGEQGQGLGLGFVADWGGFFSHTRELIGEDFFSHTRELIGEDIFVSLRGDASGHPSGRRPLAQVGRVAPYDH